jgi:hypothetical protein
MKPNGFVNKNILLFANASGKTKSKFVFEPARGLVTSRFLTAKFIAAGIS